MVAIALRKEVDTLKCQLHRGGQGLSVSPLLPIFNQPSFKSQFDYLVNFVNNLFYSNRVAEDSESLITFTLRNRLVLLSCGGQKLDNSRTLKTSYSAAKLHNGKHYTQ